MFFLRLTFTKKYADPEPLNERIKQISIFKIFCLFLELLTDNFN